MSQATPIRTAKALYDYTRQTDEEVSFPQDAELLVYDTSDPDWVLVCVNNDYGFAPANYIEIGEGTPQEGQGEEDAPPALPARPSVDQSSADQHASASAGTPAAAIAGILSGRPALQEEAEETPPPMPPRQSIQDSEPVYTPEPSDEEPPPALPKRPSSLQVTPRQPASPSVRSPGIDSLEEEDVSGVRGSSPNLAMNDRRKSSQFPSGYHLYNISEMVSVMGKRKKMPTTLGINLLTGKIFISPEKTADGPHQEWTVDKLTHYSIEGKHVFMDLVRPSKSVDFHAGAKDTAAEIVAALGDISGTYRAVGLKEVFEAGSGSNKKKGRINYDFTAQGDDEVTVMIGDQVVVLDDTKSDQWWMVKCLRNGREGVVPSNIVEITGVVSNDLAQTDTLSLVERNRLEEARLTKEAIRKSENEKTEKAKTKPNPTKMRKWTDRSGTFTVNAEFIGLHNGRIHLHKENGIKIAVPVSKMSVPDLEYVEQITGKSLDEDKPLQHLRHRSRGEPTKAGAVVNAQPEYDWFDFFLQAGVGPHQCERYARNFNRDSMDESVLPDITTDVLRTLGLKEGDILRVMKFLDNKYGRTGNRARARGVTFGGEEVIDGNATGGLFSGPGGTLRNNTRRPTPGSQASDVVDPKAFTQRTSLPPKESPVERPSPPIKDEHKGFDDDAWEVKTPQRPASIPAPTATPTPPPASASPKPLALSGAMADLSLLQAPLQPTKVNPPPPAPQVSLPSVSPEPSQPAVAPSAGLQPQATGANPSFFSQLGPMQPSQQSPPAFSPQATGVMTTQPLLGQPTGMLGQQQRPVPGPLNSQPTVVPPPPRPFSAPLNMPQTTSAFGPGPLQPQYTGLAPSQPSGMGALGMQQPTGMMSQQTFGAQQTSTLGFQSLGTQPTGFSSPFKSPPPMSPQQPGMLPSMLGAQPTGMNNGLGLPTTFTPPPIPPIPPIPQQSMAAPLTTQKTGPPPPVRFGVKKDAKPLTPQPTGMKANLAQASKYSVQ